MEGNVMPKKVPEVPVGELRAHVNPQSLSFESTASLEPPVEPLLGQERAIDAIKFGMGIKENNYHIFIAGPSKAGLTYAARTYLEEQAKKEPTPPDWCYVYNFKEPDKPKCLKISAGQGKELKKDMQEFIGALQTKVPEVFDSDDYRARDEELQQGFERYRQKTIDGLSDLAKKEGFMLQVSQVGMVLIPCSKQGQPLTQEELAQLDKEEKEKLKGKSEELQDKMRGTVKKLRDAESELKQKKDELKKDIARFVVSQQVETYLEKYKDENGVIEHLKLVQEDIVENIEDFMK
jgi:hypothetical protein